MKILAMYLPQYHRIKENDEWWGDGYTEWNAVRGAKKYFKDHKEPRTPLNNNYYDLSSEDAKTWKWQSELANRYNVFGFCIYHYWFRTGEQLLEKPMEILLRHPEIKIRYCICWANETWKRTWYGVEKEILKEQTYGDEQEWINHFNYLIQFFKDERYIKVDNKPMVCIYHTFEIDKLKEMKNAWNELAKEYGFDGIYIVSGNTGAKIDMRHELMDAYYNYEPGYTYEHTVKFKNKLPIKIKKIAKKIANKIIKQKRVESIIPAKIIYENNIKSLYIGEKKCYLGTFVDYDDTPRRQYEGMVYIRDKDAFYKNICKIYCTLKSQDREDDFVFITAWNEWGEGAYLEPDVTNEYANLEALKAAIDNVEKSI